MLASFFLSLFQRYLFPLSLEGAYREPFFVTQLMPSHRTTGIEEREVLQELVY